MRVSSDPRIRSFVSELQTKGWSIETGGAHKKIVSPWGWRHPIPGTPGDHRSALNWISQVRRRMLQNHNNQPATQE